MTDTNDTNEVLENKEPSKRETKIKEVKQKRELTAAELQKRKKMIIFPLFFLVFIGCMWLIFAPSKKAEDARLDGFNVELPTPEEGGIVSDKRDAYIQEAQKERQEERMRSLQDFTFSIDEGRTLMDENEDSESKLNPGSASRKPAALHASGKRTDSFQSSNAAYDDINKQLGAWYDRPAVEEDEQAQLELQWRVQELERQLAEQNDMDKQVALLEKSYEIAARYMPNQTTEETKSEAPKTEVKTGKIRVEPVSGVKSDVVSRLSAPMTNEEFAEEYSKPRNWGFSTVGYEDESVNKNSILACVHKTVTVTDGQEVQIRLLESMRAGSILIPRNTILSGSARISGERLNLTLRAVQHSGNVIPIELLVYDMDGNEGINVPGSEELTAVKEIAANMGSGLGSSITITDDAGSQLLSDLGRSAIQGTSQYISRKMRTVKVTLKAGYRVLLLPPQKNN